MHRHGASIKLRHKKNRHKLAVIDDGGRVGGAKRDRTADLYNAIVALSQLSYSPVP